MRWRLRRSRADQQQPPEPAEDADAAPEPAHLVELTAKLEPDDRFVTLHGPVVRGMEHFKVWVAVALVILGVGNGVSLYSIRQQAASARQRVQQQTEEYVRVLVRECTVNAARLNPAQLKVCEQRIPGFTASRAAAAQRAKDYDSFRRWGISRGWKPPPTTRSAP